MLFQPLKSVYTRAVHLLFYFNICVAMALITVNVIPSSISMKMNVGIFVSTSLISSCVLIKAANTFVLSYQNKAEVESQL